jgi:hypothetical protein
MERPNLVSLLAGIMLIFRHKLLLGAISLDLFAVLFSGAVALLPVYAKDILHTGTEGLGLLRSAPGLGAVATSIVLTQWPLKRHVGRRLFFAVGIFGLAVIAFGLSRDYVLSYLALMVLGMADNVSVYVRGSIVPLATPDALRGRVVAVESVFIGASNELGAFVAGSGAALLGPVAAVVVGGSLTLGVAMLWSAMFPSLRRGTAWNDSGDSALARLLSHGPGDRMGNCRRDEAMSALDSGSTAITRRAGSPPAAPRRPATLCPHAGELPGFAVCEVVHPPIVPPASPVGAALLECGGSPDRCSPPI